MKTIPWIIACGALIALTVIMLRDCKGPEPEIGYIPDSTQYWHNREGVLIASLKQKEADFAVLQKGYLDSIAKLHNTTAKKIKEAVTATLKGQVTVPGNGKPIILYRDTGSNTPAIQSMSQIFLSPYYFADVIISMDSSRMRLTTYDTLHLVTKEVVEGNIFNRRKYLQLDFRNANPYNVITGIEAYRVAEPKPKKFGIGPQLGVTLSADGKAKPYFGLGLQYSIIRL